MDRETANALCRSAGVADVPPGADPQDWLDDNDVFELPAEPAAEQAKVVREVFAGRAKQAASDHERIQAVIAGLTDSGYLHTTAFPYQQVEWRPLESGIWSAMSSADYSLSGYYRLGDEQPYAVRHAYGNAVVYYVRPAALDGCLEAWWIRQLQIGYRACDGDPIAGVAWAARHALELAEDYASCLGGDDAARFVARPGNANKLRQLAAIQGR